MLAEAYVATNQDEMARNLLSKSAAVHSDGELEKSLDEQIAEIRKQLSSRRMTDNRKDEEP